MPQSQAAAAAALYRPRPASNQLKEIVENSIEELFRVWDDRFRESYGPLPARVRKLLERFLECADPHFGLMLIDSLWTSRPTYRILSFMDQPPAVALHS